MRHRTEATSTMRITGRDFLLFQTGWLAPRRGDGWSWDAGAAKETGLAGPRGRWRLDPDAEYDLDALGTLVAPSDAEDMDAAKAVSEFMATRSASGKRGRGRPTGSVALPNDVQRTIVVVRVPREKVQLAERAARREGARVHRHRSNGSQVSGVDFVDWRDHGIDDEHEWVAAEDAPPVVRTRSYHLKDLGELRLRRNGKVVAASSAFREHIEHRTTIPVAVLAPVDKVELVKQALRIFS